MRRRTFVQSAVASCCAAGVSVLHAQQKFPSRAITFVVPFAAGGGGDVVARLLAKNMSERIGMAVLVENRVGAGGNIGANYVLRSPPDGYTLLSMSSSYPIQAAVSKTPFDPLEDMQPIMMVSRDPVLIVVNSSSPIRTAQDLIDAARKAPGHLTYASAGVGSIAHLGVEELAFLLNIQLSHVPYKGTSQALNDLLGRSVDMLLSSATFVAPFVKSGRVRAIGIAGTQRAPSLPEVPTFAEQGFPGYDVVDWKAMAGPKGMKPEVVAFLNGELNATLKLKEVTQRFEAEGTQAVGGSPEQMMQTVRSDIERWKEVARKADVRVK